MQTRVVAVAPDTPMLQVANQFIVNRVHHVAVVDPSNRLLGMVSESDLLVAFLEQDKPEKYGCSSNYGYEGPYGQA